MPVLNPGQTVVLCASSQRKSEPRRFLRVPLGQTHRSALETYLLDFYHFFS